MLATLPIEVPLETVMLLLVVVVIMLASLVVDVVGFLPTRPSDVVVSSTSGGADSDAAVVDSA